MPFIHSVQIRERSLTRLGRERGDCSHAAVIPFTTEPAEKRPLEQLGIEPVCFCPPMFTGDRDARGVDDISFDATRPQPTSQPEAVTLSFKGHPDPRNHPTGLVARPTSVGAAGKALLRQARASFTDDAGCLLRRARKGRPS